MAGDNRLRIHRIRYKDIGAFREFDLHLDRGQNLLVYGANGSGKTSFARLLRKWLWSASTTLSPEVHSLFSYGAGGNMVNLHAADAVADKRYGEINASVVIEVQGTPARACGNYKISSDDHETYSMPMLRKADMASDFINYRVFSEMFRGAPQTLLDLWPVFLNEILPFCTTSDQRESLADRWCTLADRDPVQEAKFADAKPGQYGKYYKKYNADLKEFGEDLNTRVTEISRIARAFYASHFYPEGAPSEWSFVLGVQHPAYAPHLLSLPLIHIAVKHGDKGILYPHEVLNEAELTKIALSIRFGATKAKLYNSPLKLLVLDDLLISLDMSNRVQVIKIILADPDFADYQKIIMTHDRGFYREIRRKIGSHHVDWAFKRLHCQDGGPPQHATDKEDIELAEEYLVQDRLEEAAVLLRKAAEANLKRFGEHKLGMVFDGGQFRSLSNNLKDAKQRMEKDCVRAIRQFLHAKDVNEDTVPQLIMVDDMAIKAREALDKPSQGKLEHKGRQLCSLLQEILRANWAAIAILDQISETKERILNPGAHAGDPALYSAEVGAALALIRQLSALADESEKE